MSINTLHKGDDDDDDDDDNNNNNNNNMLSESVRTVKRNTEDSVIASKEIIPDAMLTKLGTVELHLSGR